MKVGILTYPLNNNYGCYLQSYALLHFLQEKGFEVEYIYRRHNKPSWKLYFKYAMKTIYNNIKTLKWASPFYDYEWYYMLGKGSRLYPFFEKYIVPHTKPIYTSRGLKAACRKYNVIIVGSDQVWRAELLACVEDYFLSFIDESGVIKIAYAASFGKKSPGYTDKEKYICGNAISSFKAVSVREDIGVKLIEEYRWKCPKCEVVIDPTLLLNKSDYWYLIDNPSIKPKIFAYFLDENTEKRNIVNHVANLLSHDSINILEGLKDKNFEYPSIEEWLSCYAAASFVVTDSYHGVVFSIIFNIPFAVFVNFERGAARFETLLSMFNLKTRVVNGVNDIDRIVKEKINWSEVNKIIKKEQKRAESFLLKNIVNT